MVLFGLSIRCFSLFRNFYQRTDCRRRNSSSPDAPASDGGRRRDNQHEVFYLYIINAVFKNTFISHKNHSALTHVSRVKTLKNSSEILNKAELELPPANQTSFT